MIKIGTKILNLNKMNKPAKLFYSYFKKKKWVSNITSQILVHALPEEKTNELIYQKKIPSLMDGEDGIPVRALGLPTPLDLHLLLERNPHKFRMISFI